MAPVIYRLIDGNFLRGVCDTYSSNVGVNLWPLLNWSHLTRNARTFVYDSLPAKKPAQSEADFDDEYMARSVDLDRLARIPNVFVKDGFSRVRKKLGRQQKGVDILLATDAVLFAVRGIAEELYIYTNDLDFFPVFEALQSTSCRGRLFYNAEFPPNDLIPFADSAEPIDPNFLFEACAIGWGNSNSIFPKEMPSFKHAPFLTGTSIHGGKFEMRQHSEEKCIEVIYTVNGREECFKDSNGLLAYAIAIKFMHEPPQGLLTSLRARLA